MTETLLLKIFSEYGIVALLFILTLIGVYKLASSFLNKYLDLQKEHNNDFLSKFGDMVNKIGILSDSIKEGNLNQTNEHKELVKLIKERHEKNFEDHVKIINMIKETNNSIDTTNDSVVELNNLIHSYHGKHEKSNGK